MPIEELIRTLKVHEQELQQDKGIKKGKSLALTTQKNKTSLVSKEPTSPHHLYSNPTIEKQQTIYYICALTPLT